MANKVGYRFQYLSLRGSTKKIRPERRIFQYTTITATTIRFLQRKKQMQLPIIRYITSVTVYPISDV